MRRNLDPIVNILGNFSNNNKLLSIKIVQLQDSLVKDISKFNLLESIFGQEKSLEKKQMRVDDTTLQWVILR